MLPVSAVILKLRHSLAMLVILKQEKDFKHLKKKQTHKQDQSLLCKNLIKLLGLFVTEPQVAVTTWKA